MTPSRMRPLLLAALLCLVACDSLAQSSSAATPDLGGTSWQLVRFQGGDGATLTPDDPAKYTLRFGADGQLGARLDCNRGAGTWRSPGPGRLEIGPLAVTRAQCPPGSLHDRVVRDLAFMRSYRVRDGHLFIALQADAGIYELEPIASGATSVPPPSPSPSREELIPCA